MQKTIRYQNEKKIIAIVGMCGSGKSEVVKYLQKTKKWPKIYFGEATFERIKKEGLELNYENERKTREKIRKEMGMGAYAKLALPKIEKLLEKNETVILESLYSWAEYKIIKESGPDHDKVFNVRLTIQGLNAEGRGKSKKSAEQDAARQALELLELEE